MWEAAGHLYRSCWREVNDYEEESCGCLVLYWEDLLQIDNLCRMGSRGQLQPRLKWSSMSISYAGWDHCCSGLLESVSRTTSSCVPLSVFLCMRINASCSSSQADDIDVEVSELKTLEQMAEHLLKIEFIRNEVLIAYLPLLFSVFPNLSDEGRLPISHYVPRCASICFPMLTRPLPEEKV